ncbi:MAG: SGNH/GDSL hydrolase family protein, partial [Polyangiaceae bacterium]
MPLQVQVMRGRRTLVLALALTLLIALAGCSGEGDGAAPETGMDASVSIDAAAPDAIAEPHDAAVDAGPSETIHYFGRFDTTDAAGPRFAFPGSAIAATFTGTGIDVMLADQNQNYFDLVIDGAAPVTIMTQGTQSYTLAKDLAPGTHTVVLTKITESFQGIVQLQALTPKDGALTPTPFPFARRIEMIGDSITCGYGVLGATGCTFTPATEDEDAAWGALAARQLNAVHTAIAYSGRGVYRNYDATTTDVMPMIWRRTFADDAMSSWDTTKFSPDVVVINLGTNDFAKGDPGSAFVTAYSGFLVALRSAYPQAYFVCVV